MKDVREFLKLAERFRSTPIVDDDFVGIKNEFDSALRALLDMGLPTVVTLCGSTRFKDAFIEAAKTETLAGRMVFSVGFFGHIEDGDGKTLDERSEQKKALDELHFRKIDASDEILVLNCRLLICTSCGRHYDHLSLYSHSGCCGTKTEFRYYIGHSTANEIAYALKTGKKVRYLNPPE